MGANNGQDVYLDQDLILVRHSTHRGKIGPTKGNKVRHVPIAQDLTEVLAELLGAPEAFVLAQDDGSPLTPNMVKNPHRRAREAVGMPKLLRAAVATLTSRSVNGESTHA